MNKKERKNLQLQRHYAAIEKLVSICGGSKLATKTISNRLRHLEAVAHRAATDYCNGELQIEDFNVIEKDITEKVQKFFNGKLQGFFVNTDPRGYALKIKDKVLKETYSEIGLFTDMGGYGLISPEITGE
jgi:hypothetical protein